MSRRVCWIATAFVIVCLTAGTAQAWPPAPVRPALAAPEAGSLLDVARGWLVSVFRRTEPSPRQAGSTPSQQKYGCGVDPNGRPVPCN